MLGRENPKYKHVKKDLFHAIKDSSLMKWERNEIVGIQNADNVKILLEMVASSRLTPEGISTVNGKRPYLLYKGGKDKLNGLKKNEFILSVFMR